MRIASAAAAALFVAVTLSPTRIHAQIPGLPSGPRFEIAEVRGLADVPARADVAFGASTAGPKFAAGTKAVVVKFQTSAPPSDAGLAITWTRVDGPKAITIASHPVAAGELTSGAYDTLSNGGAALEIGRYQVSVVSAAGKIYRTLEFAILEPAPVAPRPVGPGSGDGTTEDTSRAIPYTLGELELSYPADYSLSPVAFGKAIFLVRPRPSSALFVAYKTGGGRFDLEADARPYVVGFFRSIRAPNPGIPIESRALPKGDLVGRPALGRVMVYTGPGTTKVIVTAYTFVVDGKNVYAGYIATSTAAAVSIDGSVGDVTSGEFFRLVRTIDRSGASSSPAVEETPAPAPSRKRRLPANPGDVAVLRSR